MNKRKFFYSASVVLLLAVILIVLFSQRFMTREYLSRCVFWGFSDIEDHKRFEERKVNNEPPVFNFKKSTNEEEVLKKIEGTEFKYKGKAKTIENMDEFNEREDSTAFIIVKDDTVIYEKYFNGYSRDSINTSFSAAKSFVSTLIGIAIDEGHIKSVDEPITNYIPELKSKGFEKVTIKDLLQMSSGIKYFEGMLFFSDDAKTYYFPDLRKLAIEGTELQGEPGKVFHYNNYHPLLLGIILERATKVHVAEYLQDKVWKPLGMEYPASWSIDSRESGFEKMESGINARAIDFARFGRLLLNRGNWNGRQIISEKWVTESTKPDTTKGESYYKDSWFHKFNMFYKYMWYSCPRGKDTYDFYAAGKFGQYIYISPEKNMVIVRTGRENGDIDLWGEAMYNLASKF